MSTWLLTGIENKRRDKKALSDANYATGNPNLDVLSGLRDKIDVRKHTFGTLDTLLYGIREGIRLGSMSSDGRHIWTATCYTLSALKYL